jgi:peroxiredoxin
MMRLKAIFSALCAVFLMSSCINEDPENAADLKVGDRIPDFSVQMNDGTSVSAQQLSQGVSLIMFFHTSCPDCAATLPEVEKVYKAYGQSGVQFALISREESADSIARFWEEKGLSLKYSAQATREIYNLFAGSRIPRVYVCYNGVIKAVFTDNPNPTYKEISSALAELI